mgnify:FL=1
MDDFIEEIQDNLTRKNYLSALALTLILPDICGKISYPELVSTKKRYAQWYDTYVYPCENPPGGEKVNPLDGNAVYQLRCNFLHEGSNDIEGFLKRGSVENFSEYKFIFTNSITKFSQQWAAGKEKKKKIDIQMNIVDFCNKICWVAEKFNEDNNSEEKVLTNIKFNLIEGDYENDL